MPGKETVVSIRIDENEKLNWKIAAHLALYPNLSDFVKDAVNEKIASLDKDLLREKAIEVIHNHAKSKNRNC